MTITTSALKSISDELMVLTEFGFDIETKSHGNFRFPKQTIIILRQSTTEYIISFQCSDIQLSSRHQYEVNGDSQTNELVDLFILADPMCSTRVLNRILELEMAYLVNIIDAAKMRTEKFMALRK